MSWLRYSDDFTADRSWDGVSYEARWHYLAMVEECSKARRWDGALPVTRAVRASDTPDPEKCIEELERAGRVRRVAETVEVIDLGDHLSWADSLFDHATSVRLAPACSRPTHSRYSALL